MHDDASHKAPLLVFSDDWGRHPSSLQHLIGKLLGTRQIVWVNTIGTRPLRLDLRTTKRMLEKLGHWTRRSVEDVPTVAGLSTSPHVLNPRMWPSFRSHLGRALNRWLLLRALRPALMAFPQPPVVVTTLPLVADLVGRFPAKRWVYYCVDDFGVWPGYDGRTMQQMERELVARADVVIAVSDALAEHLSTLGRQACVLTHGVDLNHWRELASSSPLEAMSGLEEPLIVFWVVIDRRMNDFVAHLSHTLQQGTIVLFGPQEDPDPALFALPRVVSRPPLPLSQLPAVARAATVLMMPYADLPVTRALQPLKLKEYLATGKPVVVSDLPATRAWAASCDVCGTAQAFAQTVAQRIVGGLPEAQRMARQRLSEENWEGKARRFEAWLDG